MQAGGPARAMDSLGCLACPEAVQEPMKKSALGVLVIDDLPRARHEYRAIGAVQNAASQIAHDVVAEGSPRLRGSRYNHIMFPFAHFGEDLIERQPVPNAHLNV